MKYKLLSFFAFFLSFFTFAQDLSVTHRITDESDEINTAEIELYVKGGVGPYQYFWSESSIDTETNKVSGATEGKEYSVKVVDAVGASQSVSIDVPTQSIPETLSAAFVPVVGFMDKYIFFDPFYALGLYDNRVKDDNGNVLLNPKMTQMLLEK